eukprot:scaffold5672_cov142-Skeletonema_menzelii.AAC.1
MERTRRTRTNGLSSSVGGMFHAYRPVKDVECLLRSVDDEDNQGECGTSREAGDVCCRWQRKETRRLDTSAHTYQLLRLTRFIECRRTFE